MKSQSYNHKLTSDKFVVVEGLLEEIIKMLYVMVYREKGGISKRLVDSV